MKAGILDAIGRTMENPVTEESSKPKKISKKITVCKNAVKIDKYGMIETFGTRTNTFIFFSTDDNFLESSFLIKEPYERVRTNGIDRQIICETNNSIYVIPKKKFYNGNNLLTRYLIDNL